jgi:hypothetical protein
MGLVLTLAGILVELVGGLLLSVDAIGPERVQRWMSSLLFLSKRVETYPRQSPWWLTLFLAFFVPLVVFLIFPFLVPAQSSGWWTGLVAGFLTNFILGFLALMLLGMASFLKFAETNHATKRTGAIGFVILTVGFLLQFVGTIFQANE